MMTRPLLAVLTLVPFVAGCYSARSESSVPNVHTVVPGRLVRGGQPDAVGMAGLQRDFGITAVVNLDAATARREAEVAARLGLDYLSLPMRATALDTRQVATFLRFVAEAGERGCVYVHCKHGMDRTGVAVAAFRIVNLEWTADRALRELRTFQAPTHQLVFPNIPPFVRSIARQRAAWTAAAAAATVAATE